MRPTLKIFGYLIALSTFFGGFVQAEPLLNGIAIHEELGKEQFIGAIYSETLSDSADTLINSRSAMKMELKVVTPDGLTTRRFSRMWIEGMAINNATSQLTAQADNMVKFDGLFKGRLEINDHIVFDQTPGQGVEVRVNNVSLGRIPDDQFFPMLLRTWVGRVPLSSTYRENLLKVGNVSADLRSRYERITPSAARIATVTSWKKPEANTEVVAATKPEPKIDSKPAPIIAPPKVELPTLAQQRSSQAQEAEQAKPVVAAKPEAKPEPTPTKPAPVVDEEDEEEKPALTAQSLLARQFYVSDLLKKVRANVRYPRRALERSQEGGIRISVEIDRKGNIKSMSWLEESRHKILNKEAWDAVERSAPFPAMPNAIPGAGFEFSAPITFTLPK